MTHALRGTLAAVAGLVVLAVVACGGEPDEPPSSPPATPTPATVAATATTPPTATPDSPATATVSPTPQETPTRTPTTTPSPTPPPTATATQEPIEYQPLSLGEPRPLPPGATLYFRAYDSCHGPQWWHRAIATEAGELLWDNPFAKLPSTNADDWGPENWPPQLEGVSASGQTLVAEVCERGACQSFDRVDPDAARGVWGSVDAGETWERWGDYPEGGVWRAKEGDIAFRDTDGRVKGFRSGEEWVPAESPPRPSVQSEVDDRLGHHEREPGDLDLYVLRDQGEITGAYSWGGEESYESHRPLWLIDHLEGQLFVGFLGSRACGEGTKTVLVDFGSGTVHPIPGLDPGRPILHKALLAEPPPPSSTAFRYDTYDTTGAVATAGSYAFLADADDPSTAVTTYEGLRDGTATALLIHTTDADGVSRAGVYDAVEAGDLFEWRQADDCFVRYTVREVRPDPARGEPRKLLAVEWMTYAFTGCSGAISTADDVQFVWGDLPNLGGESLRVPVIHGIYQIIPPGWEGETLEPVLDFGGPGQPEEYRSYSTLAEARLLPYWRDPALPEGWMLEDARIGFEGPRYGYCATFLTEERTWRDNEVYRDTAFDLCALSITGWYEPREAFDRNSVTATRVVAGRPAVVTYGGSSNDGYPINIVVYDPAIESEYHFVARDGSISGSNPKPALATVRGLFNGNLSYDLDTTGAVTAAGSYSFMGEDDDGTLVPITTYEGLRDGSATSLVIHKTHANGASRTAILDSVRTGDLVEWHVADDCFVRYRITDVKAEPPRTTFRKEFGVEWMTYAYTGCSGPIPADTVATFDWGELPNLGGESLTTPVVHGTFQIVPEDWQGDTVATTRHDPPDESPAFEERVATTVEEARALNFPYWREPTLPEGWMLSRAWEGGLDAPLYGFCSVYLTEPLQFDDGKERQTGMKVCGAYDTVRRFPKASSYYAEQLSDPDGLIVRETRVIAGRPALILWSPPGPNYLWWSDVDIYIDDPETESSYSIVVSAPHRSDLAADGNAKLEKAIALATTLFESAEEE